MIAWVSPDFTVRSTPRRISLGPSSVSTETVSPLISSVLIGSVLLAGGVGGGAGGLLGRGRVGRGGELLLDRRGDLVTQVGERDLRMMSAKKPRTTRRLASSSVM